MMGSGYHSASPMARLWPSRPRRKRSVDRTDDFRLANRSPFQPPGRDHESPQSAVSWRDFHIAQSRPFYSGATTA